MLGFNQRRLVKEFDMRFDEGSMIRMEDLSINFSNVRNVSESAQEWWIYGGVTRGPLEFARLKSFPKRDEKRRWKVVGDRGEWPVRIGQRMQTFLLAVYLATSSSGGVDEHSKSLTSLPADGRRCNSRWWLSIGSSGRSSRYLTSS